MTSTSSASTPTSLCDKSSFALVEQHQVGHYALDLVVDFETKQLSGSVTITLSSSNSKELALDTRDLNVSKVTQNDTDLEWSFGKVDEALGTCLSIQLVTDDPITIYYSTSSNASALQWLTPTQTFGKKHPYLFSQCQAIHARSMLPCQDTPAIKSTYEASITVAKPFKVIMSALEVNDGKSNSETETTTTTKFIQKIPIPIYLIAIASGNLAYKSVGPRTGVWAEPEILEKSASEFSDLEKTLLLAETYLPKYVWGKYNICVMPSSYPYGGMENPINTFVTPTLLAGDKSLFNVCAHEMAHSWSGNLVTNKSWNSFWLNEGFTVYLERIFIAMLNSPDTENIDFKYFDLEAIEGLEALESSIKLFGETNDYTRLDIPHIVDPDDAFSSVPYEKGCNFLVHLSTLVGGHKKMLGFLFKWFDKHANNTVTSAIFRQEFCSYFEEEYGDALNTIDWNSWLNLPGPLPIQPKYDTTLSENAINLAKKWQDDSVPKSEFSLSDVSSMVTTQFNIFLDSLHTPKTPSADRLKQMQDVYGSALTKNSEIKFRWFKLCISSGLFEIVPTVLEFIASVGRMKFVRPLYRMLYALDGQIRTDTVNQFIKLRDSYHPICSKMVTKDLHIE